MQSILNQEIRSLLSVLPAYSLLQARSYTLGQGATAIAQTQQYTLILWILLCLRYITYF